MEIFGWKIVEEQCIAYPYVGPLNFSDHRDLILPDTSLEPLHELRYYLETNRAKYQQFIRHKGRQPSVDIYACFQPFNEAFKTLYAFVPYLQTCLKPGDVVLNLWDRSGWTASMLAGWFPEQEIWTVWEGDKDILGYKGFDYWMSPERRERHKVIFADFQRPLPFRSASVAAVIGFDLLHRFNQPELLKEIARVATPAAPIIFPHVHLTNNFPDPFFERGCRQLHGRDYQFLFDSLRPHTYREGYILSEPATFHLNDRGSKEITPLESKPSHSDYNGCIAWLDPATKPFLQPWRGYAQEWERFYLLQNPFLTIDPVHQTIAWNHKIYDTQIEELLDRHVVYKKTIAASIGEPVPQQWMEILYWAERGKTIGEIAVLTSSGTPFMQSFLEKCWQLDLAQAVPVDLTGFRLQTLLGRQQYIPEKKELDLKNFWKQCVRWHGEEIWIKTARETLTYQQGNELIELTKTALTNEGLKKGDTLLLCTHLHYETLIIFWAAVSLGIVVVTLSTKESPSGVRRLMERTLPTMAVVDPGLFMEIHSFHLCKVIMTDEPENPLYDAGHSFEAMLSAHVEDEAIESPDPGPGDIAVILSTTGSTGNPKSIPLTHEQVIASGSIMTETYHWKKQDRYYGLGGLETMSGLRHATVGIAGTGATCIIPGAASTIHHHHQMIQEEEVTILAANPLFFKQLLFAEHVSKKARSLSGVRLALSTGNALPAHLRNDWKNKTGSPLLNYYGLTETSGICIAEPLEFEFADERSIGFPAGCMVRVVDDRGNHLGAGKTGELIVYGAGIFSGYYKNDAATEEVLKNGWFHTKDLAMMREDGSICLCGRMADIVKLPTGERIELSAVEEVVNDLEWVSDLAVCAIKENEKESIAIFFVAEDENRTAEIIYSIKDRITRKIGQYASSVVITPVTSIPRGNHNKVLKTELTRILIHA